MMRAALGCVLAATVSGVTAQSPAVAANDTRTLESLRRSGADLARPQTPLYFVSFPNAGAAKAARRALEADGFLVVKAASAAQGDAFVLVLTRTMPLTGDTVRRASEQIESVTSKYGGRYGGWDAEPRR
jgi:hypothetical protein